MSNLKLPVSFKHKLVNKSDIDETLVLWADITSKEQCKQWIAEFSSANETAWVLRTSKLASKKIVCRMEYVCHHASFKKSQSTRKISKNLDCQAAIFIVVKVQTKWSRYRNEEIKNNMPALITIRNKHAHALNNAVALSYLPASEEVRSTFETYFGNGMGITEAINFHAHKLELEMDETNIANARVNPKYRSVKYWYTEWRKINYGIRTEAGSLEKLKEKIPEYEKLGILLQTTDDPFTVVIITPIMQRSHKLPAAKDIIFIDSTSSCDAENHVITFILTVTVAGAVPLGIFITKNQTISDYVSGLNGIKLILGSEAFGGACPKYIMTDDSDAERQALNQIFPESKLLLCSFHVSQSIWRWLCEKKHNIEKDDRPALYDSFKKILRSSNADMAERGFESALSNNTAIKYPAWIMYVKNYWERRLYWCLAYRNASTHGHQTNNFSEISVRLYKDIVLNRCKAYNIVALADFTCTVLEQYYIRRLLNFAHGRVNRKRAIFEKEMKKASYLTKKDIVLVEKFSFKVPSSSSNKLVYEVDMQMGHCTCEVGRLGNLCKHQTAVFFHYFDVISCTTEERFAMAVLALGQKAKSKEFYAPLVETTSSDKDSPQPCSNFEDLGAGHDDSSSTSFILENAIETNASDDDFENLITTLREKHSKFGTQKSLISICSRRLDRVKTKSNWDTFLSTCGSTFALRHRGGAAIRVQPTSVARRRPGVTRGSKRLPVGRPAKGEKVKPKRRRNLAENVRKNLPNAKSH